MADDETKPIESLEEPTTETDTIPAEPTYTYFHLSTQALTGQFSPQTLKFHGKIGGLKVMILIDTGITHNILQPHLASHLNLPTQPIPQFSVMVGNDSHLHCQGICHDVPINLQDKTFNIPFYLFPIEGADVVLGMAWLRTLGPIQADFSIPSLTFNHEDDPITIQGDNTAHPTQSTVHQICQKLYTDVVASFHLLTFHATPPTLAQPTSTHNTTTTTQLSPEITQLLADYPTVFKQPDGLPPSRPHDNHM